MAGQGNGTGVTRRRIVKAGAGGLVLAASPFRVSILRAQEGPIKIGFPMPLSGPYSTEANDQVRCAQIAVELLQRGRRPERSQGRALVRDDKLDPGEASTRTLELIEKEKVNFVCRLALGRGAALGQPGREEARRDLQLDQPVRHHQRGLRLQPSTPSTRR